MQKSYLAIAVASLLSYTSFSHAQNISELETVVVTANRFEQSLEETIAPVEVIFKQDIDAIQAKSLAEVLARLPGVQITGNGGYGQSKSVYVRGTNSNHVLMLLNGVRMGSATSGSGNFGAIPLSGIERIEFIRGSRAAVYGADAVGGVINIITEYQPGEQLSQLEVGVGSDDYWQTKLSTAGEISENLWGKLAVNAENADGFSASTASGQEDDDGYRSRDFVAEVGTNLTPNWTLKAAAYYHDGFVEFDNPVNSNQDERVTNFSASAAYAGEKFSSNLTLARNTDRQQNNDTGNDGVYRTDRDVINWQNSYKVSDSYKLGAGIDWYENDIQQSTNTYDKTSQENLAYYVMALYDSEVIQAEVNARSDDNEEYGVNNTWQSGIAWNVSDEYRLTASAGTAFKAPSFNDLYFPSVCYTGWGCYGGNADLQPEESENMELALEASLPFVELRAAAYQQDITNLIIWGNTPENVSKALIKGVELSARFSTGEFDHYVIAEYMEPENRTTGKQLQRRAKETYKWSTSYLYEQWQFEASYRYRGKAFDDADNQTRLAAYSLVDFATSYAYSESIVLKGRIANLFDENYTVAEGYNTAGRSFYASVGYQF